MSEPIFSADQDGALEPRADTAKVSVVRGGVRTAVVAEDEPLIRMDVVEMLTQAGYQVVGQAGDGVQAVELARIHRPDVVVMDVKMPQLDGLSAADQLAQDLIAPVVILTAFSQRELVKRAADSGVMAYVVKPFNAHDVLPAIEVAIARFEHLQVLNQQVLNLDERLATRKVIDRAKGILQSQYQHSEPEAFRWIQKTAMDRQLTMAEVAQSLVDSAPVTRE